jgi:hypothetical protein
VGKGGKARGVDTVTPLTRPPIFGLVFYLFLVAALTQHGEASLAWEAHGAVALREHLKHVIEIRHRRIRKLMTLDV